MLDQLGDRRARNQHAFVDIERQPREPGLVGNVGRRFVLLQALAILFQHPAFFIVRQPAIEKIGAEIRRQMQRGQAQVHGFVDRVRHALGETQLRLIELADAPAYQVA